MGRWIALLACGVLSVHAQSPATSVGPPQTPSVRQPTDAEIERAAREHGTPTDAELERAPIPSTPKLNVTGPSAPLDLEALARQYRASRAALEDNASNASPRLQIFVTLAMPEASLRALIAQAARAHAVLVLRGAKNGSLRQTLDAARALIGAQPVAWQIDPPAFGRYQVTAAPTFVLTKASAQPSACGGGVCIAEDDFAEVTGDVSLDYALEAIARGGPTFVTEAEAFLTQLRRRP